MLLVISATDNTNTHITAVSQGAVGDVVDVGRAVGALAASGKATEVIAGDAGGNAGSGVSQTDVVLRVVVIGETVNTSAAGTKAAPQTTSHPTTPATVSAISVVFVVVFIVVFVVVLVIVVVVIQEGNNNVGL